MTIFIVLSLSCAMITLVCLTFYEKIADGFGRNCANKRKSNGISKFVTTVCQNWNKMVFHTIKAFICLLINTLLRMRIVDTQNFEFTPIQTDDLLWHNWRTLRLTKSFKVRRKKAQQNTTKKLHSLRVTNLRACVDNWHVRFVVDDLQIVIIEQDSENVNKQQGDNDTPSSSPMQHTSPYFSNTNLPQQDPFIDQSASNQKIEAKDSPDYKKKNRLRDLEKIVSTLMKKGNLAVKKATICVTDCRRQMCYAMQIVNFHSDIKQQTLSCDSLNVSVEHGDKLSPRPQENMEKKQLLVLNVEKKITCQLRDNQFTIDCQLLENQSIRNTTNNNSPTKGDTIDCDIEIQVAADFFALTSKTFGGNNNNHNNDNAKPVKKKNKSHLAQNTESRLLFVLKNPVTLKAYVQTKNENSYLWHTSIGTATQNCNTSGQLSTQLLFSNNKIVLEHVKFNSATCAEDLFQLVFDCPLLTASWREKKLSVTSEASLRFWAGQASDAELQPLLAALHTKKNLTIRKGVLEKTLICELRDDVDDTKNFFLTCEIDAFSCQKLNYHLPALIRDLLDTFLPNRLFVPQLAEARQHFHRRTDEPLGAPHSRDRTPDNARADTTMLCDAADAGAGELLSKNYTQESWSLQFVDPLAFCIGLYDENSTLSMRLECEMSDVEWTVYDLPQTVSQFSQHLLSTRFCAQLTEICVYDEIKDSPWHLSFHNQMSNDANYSNSPPSSNLCQPVGISFVQRQQYLPQMHSIKTLNVRKIPCSTQLQRGWRSNLLGKHLTLTANISEELLQFLAQFFTFVATDDVEQAQKESRCCATQNLASVQKQSVSPPFANTTMLKASQAEWQLNVVAVTLKLSYRPKKLCTKNFMNIPSVPNIPLSGVKVCFSAFSSTPLPSNQEQKKHFTRHRKNENHTPPQQEQQQQQSNQKNFIEKPTLQNKHLSQVLSQYILSCRPEIVDLLVSASVSLPVVKQLVVTAKDLKKDLRNEKRSWKQTVKRAAGNIAYAGAKFGVAGYKMAEKTDRWLERQQNKAVMTSYSKSYPETVRQSCPDLVEKHGCGDQQSLYADQAMTVQKGAKKSAKVWAKNAKQVYQSTVVAPQRTYQSSHSWSSSATVAAYGAPRLLTKSASAIGESVARMGHAVSNHLDKPKAVKRLQKFKQ